MSEERFQAVDEKLQTLDRIHDLVLGLTTRLELYQKIQETGSHQLDRRYSHHQYHRPTQSTKEFPNYSGGDILTWLWMCERYFAIDETPEIHKVKMASIHLDEKTYLWHRAMEQKWRGRLPQWDEYAMLLQDTFSLPFESPIIHFRQTGSLADFHSEWDLCTSKIKLPEHYLVDLYISALKPELKKFVRMFKPRNLLDARRLARMQEIILEKQRPRPSATTHVAANVSSSLSATGSSFPAIDASKPTANYKNAFLSMGTQANASTPSFKANPAQSRGVKIQDLHGQMFSRTMEQNKEAEVNVNCEIISDFRTPELGSAKIMGRACGSLNFIYSGGWQGISHARNRSVSFLPLSPLHSLLSLFAVRSWPCDFLQVKRCSWVSKEGEGKKLSDSNFLDCGVTWLEKNQQTHTWSTSIQRQQMNSWCFCTAGSRGELQLSPSLSGYFPNVHTCTHWLIKRALFSHKSPTITVSLSWFKGCLIKMLIGSCLVPCLMYNIQWLKGWLKGCLLKHIDKVTSQVCNACGLQLATTYSKCHKNFEGALGLLNQDTGFISQSPNSLLQWAN